GRSEPAQASVDERLRQQMKMFLQQSFALLLGELRKRQRKIGAHNFGTGARHARREPADHTSPTTARRKVKTPEVGKQRPKKCELYIFCSHSVMGSGGIGAASSGILYRL